MEIEFLSGPFDGRRIGLDGTQRAWLPSAPEHVLRGALRRDGAIPFTMTEDEFHRVVYIPSRWRSAPRASCRRVPRRVTGRNAPHGRRRSHG